MKGVENEVGRVAVEDGAVAVEDVDVAVAVLVPEVCALGALDDDGIDHLLPSAALNPDTTRPSAKTERWLLGEAL